MSFENLMQEAKEIEKSAAEAEYRQRRRMASMNGGAHGSGPGTVVNYDEIKQKYEGQVTKYFEPFTHIPDPKTYDGPIKDLGDAMEGLSYGEARDPISERTFKANQELSSGIDNAKNKLGSWTGEAADGFK